MNRYIFLILFILLPFISTAQRLVYGQRSPQIEATTIVKGKLPEKGVPLYIDFFILNSSQHEIQLNELKKLATKYDGEINFVIIAKGNKNEITEYFKDVDANYSVIHDESGQTFNNFGVKFVPFSVLLDRKGKFVWQGKNSTLSDDIVQPIL